MHLQKVSSSPWSSPKWEAHAEPILPMGKLRVGTGGSSPTSFPTPWLQQGPNEAVPCAAGVKKKKLVMEKRREGENEKKNKSERAHSKARDSLMGLLMK